MELPGIARAASLVALALAAFGVVGAFLGTPANLIVAPVFLVGGLGIWKGRIWSAYGLALFSALQLMALPIAWIRDGALGPQSGLIAGAAGLSVALAILFFSAGRSLTAAGAAKGHPVAWIAFCGVASAVAICFVFVQPFANPSASMENTLLAGDRIFVQRLPRVTVRTGDLVVFRYPPDPRQSFIKRLVGMPGDRIRMVRKALYVNGKPIEEPYAIHRTRYMDDYRDNFPGAPPPMLSTQGREMLADHMVGGEIVVPADSYFVLGDNRDDSLDSRYWGFVPAANVIGKPVLIYWSRELPMAGGAIRWDRIFKPI